MTTLGSHEMRSLGPAELTRMRSVIDAVCDELGVKSREQARREAVARRVLDAYRNGRNLPLNMVAAGLSESPRITE